MFDNPDGPISIIYRFIRIKNIYKYNLNCVCKSIYSMISDQMHLRNDIDQRKWEDQNQDNQSGKPFWNLTASLIKDIFMNKKVDREIAQNVFRYSISLRIPNLIQFILKDKRVDPSDDNNYAIRLARHHNYNEMVDLLQKYCK